MAKKTSVTELSTHLKEPFVHLELAGVNDHAAYVIRCEGDYPFHSHTKDELYYVVEGELVIRYKNAPTETLHPGDCITVPAFVTHSPSSTAGALVLMVKPKDMFHHLHENG
ncbi:MAG TPA: cupin domain-containing protein [Polyangiaceae bacterium]|nr:cupin domain-containing protein [Polyangiaceae bacterium]